MADSGTSFPLIDLLTDQNNKSLYAVHHLFRRKGVIDWRTVKEKHSAVLSLLRGYSAALLGERAVVDEVAEISPSIITQADILWTSIRNGIGPKEKRSPPYILRL
jgi:hypothetical protein